MTEEGNGLPELPKGWVWTAVGEIAQPIEKVQPRKNPDTQFTYLDISSIDNRLNRVMEPKIYYGSEAPSRARQLIRANDVLFSTVRTYLKNIALVPETCDGQIASTGFSVLRGESGISSKYLFYYSLTDPFLTALSKLQRGTSYPAVRDSDVRAQPIPLPPLIEQHRIVAKIEELFTQLDAGVAALEKAKAQLRRYRQAVLKAAVEGELTREWREAHRGELEPASVLLERILEERRAKREAKHPSKRYKPPTPPETDDLPELPEGWVWATIEQVAENFDSMRVPVKAADRKKMQGPYPYYGASGIIDHVNDYLFDGDFLLVAEDGANLLARSTPISFQAHGKFWVNNHAHVLETLAGCPLGYLETFFNVTDLKFYITGSAQPKLTQRNLNKIPVPLPSLTEQWRIVAEVEQRLSVADEMEKTVEQSLKRAERLRQSILKRAFEGKLAPQDPSDEPASVLLERIKAEKARREAEGKGRKRSRKKKQTRQLELI